MIILDSELAVISISPEAEYWLAELDDQSWSTPAELPVSVRMAAAQLRRLEQDVPGLKVRSRSGRWLGVHASFLRGVEEQTAVVIEPATAAQLGSLLLVDELHLSPHTVQEHVRAAYDKVGVGNRRELIAALLGEH